MVLTVSDRIAGLTAGLGLDRPGSPPTGEQLLAGVLLDELSGDALDLGRVIGRWVALADRPFDCPVVARSLGELNRTGAPPAEGSFEPGLGATLVTLAGAVRLFQTPRNLVSGVYHLARLLDPHPIGTFTAVAAAVAAGRLLEGYRDFVPAVLDVLLANQAPEPLIAAVRRAPVWVRSPALAGAPETELGTVFWALHHFGQAPEVLDALAPAGPLGRTIGRALLGARLGPLGLAGQGDRTGGFEPTPNVVEGPDR